jgi:DNA gyrase subunit A
VSDLRVMGRATQGVRLINLKEDDGIAAVAKVDCELEETEELPEGTEIDGNDELDDSIDSTELPENDIEI